MTDIAEEKINNTLEVRKHNSTRKKVIIFTNFTDTLNKIHDHFKKSSVKLDGKMSKIQRQHSVDEFQNSIKVFVGNLSAQCWYHIDI